MNLSMFHLLDDVHLWLAAGHVTSLPARGVGEDRGNPNLKPDHSCCHCFRVLAAVAVLLSSLTPGARAQESLTLQKKYDLGMIRYTEGLDFYNDYLWHTTRFSLYRLNLDSAEDIDGDGDYDLQPDKTWAFTHNNHSESSAWFNGELFNFTYLDTMDIPSDDIFTLDLNDDGTYQWQHVGDGLGETNWGSCRDRRNPGESIIYTGHYDNLLMWYEPESGNTIETLEVPDLDDIEDLGMDLYGTIWTSSFNNDLYPGLYRVDPVTGDVLGTFYGPAGLSIIDGMAIRSLGDHDLLYVTGKNAQFIWEYLVPAPAAEAALEDFAAAGLELHPNFPNPFNLATRVTYYVPENTHVQLGVYDVMGRLVTKLEDGVAYAGLHSVTWDAGEATSNYYFVRLHTGKTAITRRVLLLK